MNRILLLIFFLLPFHALSQHTKLDYISVDSFAATVKYRKNLAVLTQTLTSPYQEQELKARSIFRWITENIRYDYNYYNKYFYKGRAPKTYKCRNDQDCEPARIVWETKYLDKILRNKKAVCQGYAMLFKKMCEIAGLKSEAVTGYARTEHFQVGTAGTLDHAWNAVWIDSTWYLLDATWAAGGCSKGENGKLLSFSKNFNEYYWLTPPADFAKNHYPENSKWVLVPDYTKDSFAANPYYQPGEIQNISLISPASGIIAAKKDDTIRFKINYTGAFNELQINSNLFRNPDIWIHEKISKRKSMRRIDTLALNKQRYLHYRRTGSLYEFEYVVPDNSLYYLDILFDRQRVMRFRVVTKNQM